MRLRQVLFGIILGISLGIYDVIFSTFVPEPFSFLNLSLPIIAFCLAIERRTVALAVALSAGLVFDLFTIGGSGFAVARIAAAAAAAWLLQTRVLTNRSLYATVLLAFVIRAVDTVWMWGISLIFTIFGRPLLLTPAWDTIWKRAGMDVLIVGLLFLLHALLSRQFRRRS